MSTNIHKGEGAEERVEGSLADNIRVLTDRLAQLPILSEMTEDEVLGYDESGIPTANGDFAKTDLDLAI